LAPHFTLCRIDIIEEYLSFDTKDRAQHSERRADRIKMVAITAACLRVAAK
jgi:hypothetical protein